MTIEVSPEFQINTTNDGLYYYPDAIALGPDRFVCVWEASRSSSAVEFDIFAQIFDADGNKIGGELLVNTDQYSAQRHPSVTSFDDGSFIVTWNSFTRFSDDANDRFREDSEVFGQRFDASGAKVGGEFIISESPDAGLSEITALCENAGAIIPH